MVMIYNRVEGTRWRQHEAKRYSMCQVCYVLHCPYVTKSMYLHHIKIFDLTCLFMKDHEIGFLLLVLEQLVAAKRTSHPPSHPKPIDQSFKLLRTGFHYKSTVNRNIDYLLCHPKQ